MMVWTVWDYGDLEGIYSTEEAANATVEAIRSEAGGMLKGIEVIPVIIREEPGKTRRK